MMSLRRLDDGGTDGLIALYLDRRAALVRFFALRLGSAERGEDIVQEIYLKISAMEAGAIAEVRNPVAFLYRLGSNLMLDHIKQARRATVRDTAWRDSETEVSGGVEVADLPRADDALAAKQRLAAVIAAVEELPPQTRRAFRLHKLEGLSHSDTAARMGISRSAVEKHISASLKHLMKRLE